MFSVTPVWAVSVLARAHACPNLLLIECDFSAEAEHCLFSSELVVPPGRELLLSICRSRQLARVTVICDTLDRSAQEETEFKVYSAHGGRLNSAPRRTARRNQIFTRDVATDTSSDRSADTTRGYSPSPRWFVAGFQEHVTTSRRAAVDVALHARHSSALR